MLTKPSCFNKGAIGQVFLSFSEMKCLEIALYFLIEQLKETIRHPTFILLQQHHAFYLEHCLKRIMIQKKMNEKEKAEWSFTSYEDVKWLAAAVKHGVTWKTVAAMSTDVANFKCDLEKMTVTLSNEQACSMFENSVCRHHQYYQQFMPYKNNLLLKLQEILRS